MTELLTAAQMRAIEQAAIASGEVTGLELMERAGRGVVEAIFEESPELAKTSHRAVVLCGPGNNGGDGFVVARLLKEWGWEVEVFQYGDPEKLPPDARVNYERWLALGREVTGLQFTDEPEMWRATNLMLRSDVVVDALFGTGLSREPPDIEPFYHVVHFAFADRLWKYGVAERPFVVAVDVPTGLCSDSGRQLLAPAEYWLSEPYAAHLTVTFHQRKLGHVLDGGPHVCTKVVCIDIGLPRTPRGASAPLRPRPAPQGGGEIAPTLGPGATLAVAKTQVKLTDGRALDGLAKLSTHKYAHGHALILSGGAGRGGAARLAARGAIRIGAGVVTVGCPPEAVAENAARLDAVMLRPVADADAFGRVLEDRRINALCLGPGLGTGAREVALVACALGVPVPALSRDLSLPEARAEGEGPGSGPGRDGGIAGGGGKTNPVPALSRDLSLPEARAEGEGPGSGPGRDGGIVDGGGKTNPVPALSRDLSANDSDGRQGGPGSGPGRGRVPRALVLDADALTILSREPDLFAALHENCVLTPHAGEFARLFPDIAAKLAEPATKGPAWSKVDATRAAAKRAGCIVLYKGPDTVIADPSGRCSINSAHYDRAAPWLATAGSGDVLAGFITGLLARGFAPMQAAETAAWLHVECALTFGPGLIAEDLPDQLPAVFRDLGL